MKADTKARERETHKPKMWVQVSWIRCYDIASRLRLCWLRFVIGNQPSAVRIFIRNMLGLRLYIDCVYLNKCVRVLVWRFVCVCVCLYELYMDVVYACSRLSHVYTQRLDWIIHSEYHATVTKCIPHSLCVVCGRERVETSLLFVSVFHLHLSRLSRFRASSNQMMYILEFQTHTYNTIECQWRFIMAAVLFC